jgi:hypothetical protein
VIFRNQHIAVVRNNCAIAKITDNDPAVVDAEQLVEVRSPRLSSTKKLVAFVTLGKAMTAAVMSKRRAKPVDTSYAEVLATKALNMACPLLQVE